MKSRCESGGGPPHSKTLARFLLALTVVFAGGTPVQGQAFTNLFFESASGLNGNQPGGGPVTQLLPGWSVFYGTSQQSQILYNDETLGSTAVDLVGSSNPYGPSSIQAFYGVLLQGGETATDASIRQTGLIPVGTMSIEFKAEGDITLGPLLLSFNGENIPFFTLATAANYTLYGGNISGLAGTTGQLEFSVPSALEGYSLDNSWNLDSIVFSTSFVPEPGTCALILGGAVLMGVRRWKRN